MTEHEEVTDAADLAWSQTDGDAIIYAVIDGEIYIREGDEWVPYVEPDDEEDYRDDGD